MDNRLIRGRDLSQLKSGEVAPVTQAELKQMNRELALRAQGDDKRPQPTILDEAQDIVYNNREKLYGHPREHFARTIGMINAQFAHKLKEPFVVDDWPIMMILDKVARNFGEYKRDVSIDIAGYAATLDRLQEK